MSNDKLSTDLDSYGGDKKPGSINAGTPTQRIPAMADSRRVIVGYQDMGPNSGPPRPIGSTVFEEVRKFGALRATSPETYQNTVNMLRATGLLGSRANAWSSIESAYKDLLGIAAGAFTGGKPITVQAAAQMLFDQRGSEGAADGTGSGRGGSRAYTGPTTTTTLANERDLRSTADAVASTVIGRGITDDEFQKVLKQVRSAERSDPTISTPGIGTSVTQSGLSAEGRQDIIREALMKGPEAKDYSKATTMMDVFYKALESRPEGA